MTSNAGRARRYLLRDVTDEESLTIEREYFESEDALEAIAAAEDDLIEDYLDDALTLEDRRKFEREYLATAGHRRRVETIRQLRNTAMPSGHAARWRLADRSRRARLRVAMLATAAILILVVGMAARFRSRSAATDASRPPLNAEHSAPSAPQSPIPRTPRVFAFVVPAQSLRSTVDADALIIPVDTDIVSLQLPSEGNDQATHATVRTADAEVVWTGPVERTRAGGPRIDVPASLLRPNDYVIAVSGDRPQSSSRYALHVRRR